MAPTLHAGDVLLLLRTADRPHERDVVAVSTPADDGVVIKRVVATAGQQVAVADGVLFVDDVPVAEPSVEAESVDGTWFGPVLVPSESVFVLGDHRELSIDSRHHGPVSLDDVVGVAVVRLWPPSRLGDVLDP